MSYIAPNTDLVICKGVPLDNTYRNTLYWDETSSGSTAGMASQEEYFASMAKYKYDKLYYQRVDKNKIRVQQCADDLYDCNYMYFRNTAFGNKWFYAFITGVEYINNVTSEITYEIDVMQTWHFSYEVGYCFVQREHVNDDTIGANTVPEEINYGDAKCVDTLRTGLFNNYYAVVALAYDPTDTDLPGGVYGGMATGLYYVPFDINTIESVHVFMHWLDDIVADNKSESIVTIWTQPINSYSARADATLEYNRNYYDITPPSTIDGYIPRNNKLFTYPYNVLYVDCGNDVSEYRWEFFTKYNTGESDVVEFMFTGTTAPNPEIACVPYGYNIDTVDGDITNTDNYNFNESIIMRGFPQLGWSVDTYKQWVANGGFAQTTLRTIASAVGLSGTAANSAINSNGTLSSYGANLLDDSANIAAGIYGTGSGLIEIANMASKGGTGHGMQGSDVMMANRRKDFYFKIVQVRADIAKSIDNYFEMYGYRVNALKQPNREGRKYWNYVQTAGANILSNSVPADDVAKIESIYDNGITFWHSTSNVGRYELRNEIVTSN